MAKRAELSGRMMINLLAYNDKTSKVKITDSTLHSSLTNIRRSIFMPIDYSVSILSSYRNTKMLTR